MSIAQMLLPELDNEIKSTRKLLECLPDGKFDYKPHEKSMSLGRLAGHVAEIPSYGIAAIQLDKLEMEAGQQPFTPKTKKEVLEAFDKYAAEVRAAIAGASDEHLAKMWSFQLCGQGSIRDASRRGLARHDDEPLDPSSGATRSLPATE